VMEIHDSFSDTTSWEIRSEIMPSPIVDITNTSFCMGSDDIVLTKVLKGTFTLMWQI
jgi:hypothetical protein